MFKFNTLLYILEIPIIDQVKYSVTIITKKYYLYNKLKSYHAVNSSTKPEVRTIFVACTVYRSGHFRSANSSPTFNLVTAIQQNSYDDIMGPAKMIGLFKLTNRNVTKLFCEVLQTANHECPICNLVSLRR